MSRRSGAIAAAIGALILAIIVVLGGLAPSRPGTTAPTGDITLNAETIVVDDVPIEVFIGVHTARRAVLQVSAPDATATDLTTLIREPRLVTEMGTIEPGITQRTLSDGTPTLTLEFTHPRAIGAAVFEFTADRQYALECKWPNS